MIALYRKINLRQGTDRFLMPKSLHYIKILAEQGIDWKGLHIIDAFSLVCSIRIDHARTYLRMESKNKMQAAGISAIARATEKDFDAL